MLADGVEHDVGVGQDSLVSEPQNHEALAVQIGVPQPVPLLAQPVNAAIQFDHQLELVTAEVRDPRPDPGLSAKFHAFEPPIAQQPPHRRFRDEAPTDSGVPAVHDARMTERREIKQRSPAVWARVRQAYLAGEPAASVARRFDVGLGNLRFRANAEGWTRKAMMAERSDAFIALPGGIGTFEELFEVWTWRQLGYHDKPLGLLNVAGYYDGLLGFLRTSVASGFMGEWQMELLQADISAEPLLRNLVQATGPGQAPTALRSVI
eukprot:gene41104-55572_t